MIWFAILFGIALAIAATAYVTTAIEPGLKDDWVFALIPGVAVLIGASILAWLAFQLIGGHNTEVAQRNGNAVLVWEQETPLRALSTDSESLSGSTFLTMGYVDGNRVYSYIYQTDGGGFIVDTAGLGSAMVYEVDGLEEPYMRELRSRGSWWWTWTARPERVEFYVPTGSVQDESYDVSIEGKVG